MPRQLQVWGLTMHLRATGRQHRVIVAATSRNEAALLFKCQPAFLKDYGSITGNPVELAAAMAKPRTVFYASGTNMGGEYLELKNESLQS